MMSITETLIWHERQFDQLNTRELYQLMRLRVDVFVVEQQCPYPELDGQDMLDDTTHLFATAAQCPVAYARVLAPHTLSDGATDSSPPAVHIGRVVVAKAHRGGGMATELMHRTLQYCMTHYPQHAQALAAQVEVRELYARLGFSDCSEPYVEDGIPHVDMHRPAPSVRILALSTKH